MMVPFHWEPASSSSTRAGGETEHSTAALLGPSTDDRWRECRGKIKCVLVGDGAVGKTSLVVSYTTNGYPIEYVPTAFDNYNVVVTVDGQPIRFQLCDTAGQDDFDSLRPLCYPSTDVFLVCFSVVSPTSFYNVTDKWLPELRYHAPGTPLVLIGTQCDLRCDVKVLIELANYHEQPVTEAAARRLAEDIKAASYIECSALTQKNLKEVFDTAIVVGLQRNENLKKLTSLGRNITGVEKEDCSRAGYQSLFPTPSKLRSSCRKLLSIHRSNSSSSSTATSTSGGKHSSPTNSSSSDHQKHVSSTIPRFYHPAMRGSDDLGVVGVGSIGMARRRKEEEERRRRRKRSGWKTLCCFSS